MNILEKLGAAAVLALTLFYSGHWVGAGKVQKAWDAQTAKQEAVAEESEKQDKAARKAVDEQHAKDLKHATSQAGRAALARWLHDHGLLPDGSKVPGTGTDVQAKGSQGADGASRQCGTGGGIEDFALRCAQDAITIGAWQDWAKREGLETE